MLWAFYFYKAIFSKSVHIIFWVKFLLLISELK